MIIEFRTYRLKPGTSAEFLRVMQKEATPLVRAAGIKVITSGLSLVAEDGHEEAYLVREFASTEELERQEATFYGSDAWRSGPREAIMACVESYHSIALDADELTLNK